MAKIIECVPNISEGRNHEVIEACVDTVRNTAGVTLLDYSSDASHNRSVITFMGSPEGVMNAATALAKKAAELLDVSEDEILVASTGVIGRQIPIRANIPAWVRSMLSPLFP